MIRVGILGSGWLGLALAKETLKNGHKVRLTTTTESKLSQLLSQGYTTKLLKLNESSVTGEPDFFEDIDTLLITIPPGIRKNIQRNYVALMEQLIKRIEFHKIKKILFTSSTSVYGFQEGIITESSNLLGYTLSSKQIITVEQRLIKNKNFESCIVRLGGLIGPNRHPIFNLSGEKNLPNPHSPINLIHQIDAVAIILKIIENWKGDQIFNAVTPFHPPRKEYYEKMAIIKGLSPPIFKKKGIKGGIISSDKVIRKINCQFSVKNLLI